LFKSIFTRGEIMAKENVMVNDKREIFGWAMYDWANSAFSTTVATVFLAPYVQNLAADAAKAEFLVRTGTEWTDASGQLVVHLAGIPISPYSFMGYCISLSVLLQVFFLPILGAIADYSHMRKQMMQIFATAGAILTIALFFVTGSSWWLGGLLFLLANLSLGASIVFYNAYLPDIASEDRRDSVSSYGWAMGYLGDFILLALNLAFYMFRDKIGIPTGLAIRINLASAGIWWLTFAFFTWERLRPRHPKRSLPKNETYLSIGFKQLGNTIREIKHFPETIKFLLAYFLYNDGIQTVIAMASTFATAPLLSGGLELDLNSLTIIILIIQFVAFLGALFWGKLAGWVGAKRSIIISLVIWVGVVVYAYFGMRGDGRFIQFLLLGVVIAIVLGGSQAISRSLFAQMVPTGKEAEFYSFYEVSDRGTSWTGPLVFGLANQFFGSLRYGILSLIIYFILGVAILPFVNVNKAITDAKKYKVSEI
jgi:UMF1 family MFS transporter